MAAREYVHAPCCERLLDLVWSGVLGYLTVAGPSLMGKRPPDTDQGTWRNTQILASVLPGILLLLLALRRSKHRVRVDGTTVTYTQYRVLGLVPTLTRTFELRELGQLVLDTQRRCLGACGFLGIYVTRGFTTMEESLEVAFEIPIVYSGWTQYTEGCALGCYNHSFQELIRVLDFRYQGVASQRQRTTITGGTWDQQMAAQLNADLSDTLNSHETFLAINWAVLPAGGYSFERQDNCWRSSVLVVNNSGPNPTRASMGL